MNPLMQNLAVDDAITNEQDVLGGGSVFESGLYNAVVSLAYMGVSDGGATSVTVHLKTAEGREIRETHYVTSSTAKGGKNYYTTKDGEKKYLPGFNLMNSLSLLTVAKDLANLQPEEKVVNLYSFDAKKEVPTKVQVLVELLDKPICVGLLKQTVDKKTKNQAGEYVPTGDTREENTMDKFFRASDRKTTAEIRAGAAEGTFAAQWAEKWTGVTRDRTDKDAKATAGAPRAGGTAKPTQSLFAA